MWSSCDIIKAWAGDVSAGASEILSSEEEEEAEDEEQEEAEEKEMKELQDKNGSEELERAEEPSSKLPSMNGTMCFD